MKKTKMKQSIAALAMAAVVAVSLLGYGCGSKPASTAGGVSGDFTGTAKGMGGDVTVTLAGCLCSDIYQQKRGSCLFGKQFPLAET